MHGKNTYDERLFKSGFRKWMHERRFYWLQKELGSRVDGLADQKPSVVELGCFNCRSLKYLGFEPSYYRGLDAGWEQGVFEAMRTYPQLDIRESTSVEDLSGDWDYCVALETLEHLPRPDVLNNYLEHIARNAQILIATVPVEVGPLFAAKFLYKKFIQRDRDPHTLKEFFYQSLGLCQFVRQDNHCGFDYRDLVSLLERYFVVEKVEGLSPSLPALLNTQIGIVARSRAREHGASG